MKKILFGLLMLAVAVSASAQKPTRLKVAIEPNSALSALNPSYASFQIGDKVKVAFNLNSREYNGRWYTDVRAWRIEPAGSTGSYTAPAQGYDYETGAVAGGAGYVGSPAPAPAPQGYDYAASAGSYAAPLSEEDLPF